MPGRPDVLVIGGGVIGLASACELAAAGIQVTLVEQGVAGGGASAVAAGMLAPLDQPRRSGPFFEACRRSRDLWPEWLERLSAEGGRQVEYDAGGTLEVAFDRHREESFEELAAAARTAGEPCEEIGLAELYRLVPDLATGARRALLLTGDQRVHAGQALAALLATAHRRGVVIEEQRQVRTVRRLNGAVEIEGDGWHRQAALLVLAAGAWSGRLPALPQLSVRPVRGQVLRLEGVRWPWNGVVRIAGAEYAVRRGHGGLVVGSTLEEAGFEEETTSEGRARLQAAVRRWFPTLDRHPVAAHRAGLRPGTPDDLPLLGRLPDWPVIVATGHYRHGLLLAPWTAELVRRLAVDPAAAAPDAAFSPTRFAALAGSRGGPGRPPDG